MDWFESRKGRLGNSSLIFWCIFPSQDLTPSLSHSLPSYNKNLFFVQNDWQSRSFFLPVCGLLLPGQFWWISDRFCYQFVVQQKGSMWLQGYSSYLFLLCFHNKKLEGCKIHRFIVLWGFKNKLQEGTHHFQNCICTQSADFWECEYDYLS